MFTGIITDIGTIVKKDKGDLEVSAPADLLEKLQLGLSISVSGICLTVIKFNNSSFTINYMPETEKITNLGILKTGDLVNLELPATPESFLAGHIVQGHVDCIGEIESITKEGNSRIFKFIVPESVTKYIIVKGSIAVNGISLTVIKCQQNFFTVGIIPHTWDRTMLHKAKQGDRVNIETDVFAKYIEKLMINPEQNKVPRN